MKILIASGHRNIVGGVEKYLQSAIPALSRADHDVAFVYEKPSCAAQETIDAPEQHLPAWCLPDRGLESVLHAVEKWGPDLVYSQGIESDALESALLSRYPTILYAHNYYGTCVSGRKCHSFPSIRPCNRVFGPACLGLYYPRRCGGLNPATMLQLFRRQSRLHARLTEFEAILVASQSMLAEYQHHGIEVGRLEYAPLPVEGGLSTRKRPLRESTRNKLLFLGRLSDLKGADYLIRAVALASATLGRSLELTIAGDGPQRAALEMLARRLSVRANFTGWVAADKKEQLLLNSDLLAVPSLWPEPFGLVGSEAARFGVPAVGYDVGGIGDWLRPGVTGELAPGNPPTVDGLAAAIDRALSDPEHYRALCENAAQMISQPTLNEHVRQLENIFCRSARLCPVHN